jgi:hypothetical protein
MNEEIGKSLIRMSKSEVMMLLTYLITHPEKFNPSSKTLSSIDGVVSELYYQRVEGS